MTRKLSPLGREMLARMEIENGRHPETNGHLDEIDLLAGIRTGDWLDTQTFEPLRYHVPGIIPEGSVLLVGAPKIGKSWFVLAVGLAVATGGQALGKIRVPSRPVFYLALEDGDRRMQDRSRTILDGARIPADFHYITRIEPGTVTDTITAWLDVYGNKQPLVILDTLGKVMPAAKHGETTYQRDYRIAGDLKRVVDIHPGSSLVTNHHDRKAESEDFVDNVSGTHGLAGAADTIIVLQRKRHETDGVVKVTGRDVAEGEYALTFVNGSAWQLDGNDLIEASARVAERRVTANLDDRSLAIVRYVTNHPAGVGAAEIATAFDITPNQASTYLSRLADTNRITRKTRGTYIPRLTTPVTSVTTLLSESTNNTRNT